VRVSKLLLAGKHPKGCLHQIEAYAKLWPFRIQQCSGCSSSVERWLSFENSILGLYTLPGTAIDLNDYAGLGYISGHTVLQTYCWRSR
jgi:hypothetical protein